MSPGNSLSPFAQKLRDLNLVSDRAAQKIDQHPDRVGTLLKIAQKGAPFLRWILGSKNMSNEEAERLVDYANFNKASPEWSSLVASVSLAPCQPEKTETRIKRPYHHNHDTKAVIPTDGQKFVATFLSNPEDFDLTDSLLRGVDLLTQYFGRSGSIRCDKWTGINPAKILLLRTMIGREFTDDEIVALIQAGVMSPEDQALAFLYAGCPNIEDILAIYLPEVQSYRQAGKFFGYKTLAEISQALQEASKNPIIRQKVLAAAHLKVDLAVRVGFSLEDLNH